MVKAELDHHPIIEVKSLTKKFDQFLAVNNISFTVLKGDVFAFLGPNGAGKTTTIKMLTTLLKPTSGSILVNGYNPGESQDGVRRSIGIVFQDASLDEELTAYENLEFHGVLYGVPKEIRRDRNSQMLQLVELWERRNDLVKYFSGGMKRRLEIARGFVHHPQVFFLDEPTLGLDPQTRKHIWNYIEDLNREEHLTIFFTTHNMEEAEKVAGKIAIIDQGKIISQGSPEELKSKTATQSLEEAFLMLTGRDLRSDQASAQERMRTFRKLWRGHRR